MPGIAVALLVDSEIKGQYLAMSVREAGHRLVATLTLAQAREQSPEQIPADAWLVDLACDPEDESPAGLQTLLEQGRVPVIVSDSSDCRPGSDAHGAWLRRTLDKLRQLTGEINLQSVPRAEQLWVLAASAGGPAAVKRFLSELPPGLGLAFLYIQHIDTGYVDTLVRMMGQTPYPAALASNGAVLQADRVLMVESERRVDLLDNGTLSVSDEPWAGPYAPSVDQMVANAARVYGERLGLIVFSGMGDDGASASRLVRRSGGQVWAQTPDDCTASSMPESALATGAVTASGSPEELARRLVARCRAAGSFTLEDTQGYESPAAH